MLETIYSGGIMMVPILVGSVLALTIIVERIWILQRNRIVPPAFVERMASLLSKGRNSEALSACRENDSAMARILEIGLLQHERPRQEIQEALQLAGRREASIMMRWIGALGSIAALEPLMGLLGTVLGLIRAFQKVEESKIIGDPSVVAEGVWVALITTAAGLIIAIPTYAFYRYLRGKVFALVLDMEQSAFQLLQSLSKELAPEQGAEGENS